MGLAPAGVARHAVALGVDVPVAAALAAAAAAAAARAREEQVARVGERRAPPHARLERAHPRHGARLVREGAARAIRIDDHTHGA